MEKSLAEKYMLSPEDILKVIARSPRCEQMVKGFVAEYHLERKLDDLVAAGKIMAYQRLDRDGQPDFLITTADGSLKLECKMFMSAKSSQRGYKVDFQKTRNSPGDPLSRFYRRADFDILAACTYNQNERWDFVFIWTVDLPIDEKAGQDCLKKAVYYRQGDPLWSTSLEEILDHNGQEYVAKRTPSVQAQLNVDESDD